MVCSCQRQVLNQDLKEDNSVEEDSSISPKLAQMKLNQKVETELPLQCI